MCWGRWVNFRKSETPKLERMEKIQFMKKIKSMFKCGEEMNISKWKRTIRKLTIRMRKATRKMCVIGKWQRNRRRRLRLRRRRRKRMKFMLWIDVFDLFKLETCNFTIYLSIFAAAVNDKKLPVIVFLHGESFEWNSGNPYDGTVLASYSEVVVVTLNYRIGLLGEYGFSSFCFLFSMKIID